MIKTLNTIQEEKTQLVQQSNRQLAIFETKLGEILLENEALNEKCNSLSKLSFEQQKQMQKMFIELDEKKDFTEKQAVKKSDEIKRLKQLLNLAQEKIKYLQQKHSTEIENIKKKLIKDYDQLKFQHENNTIRNGELSRSNLELRKKLQQLEADLKEANEKSFLNKQNCELNLKQKKELKEESDKTISTLKKEIQSLEKLRDDYLKKSQQQQDVVDQMLKQLNEFQTELDSLVARNVQLNDKLKKSNSNTDAYKKKYNELKQFLKQELDKIRFNNDEKENKQQLEQEKSINNHTERLFETNQRIKNLIKDLKIDDILNEKTDSTNKNIFSLKSSSTISSELNDLEIEWCDLKISNKN